MTLVDRVLVGCDVEELLTDVTRHCARILDIEAAVLLVDDGHDRLNLMSTICERPHSEGLFRLLVEEGPCRDCYVGDHAVSIADLRTALRRWPRFAPAAMEAGFISAHAVPVRGAETALGALGLVGTRAADLGDVDLLIAQTFVRIAGMAVLQQREPAASTVASRLGSALGDQTAVERAKGFLRGALGVTVDEASTLLQTYSRTHRVHVADVAKDLVAEGHSNSALMADFAELAMTNGCPRQCNGTDGGSRS